MKIALAVFLLLALALSQAQGGWIYKKKVSHALVSQNNVPINIDALAVKVDGPHSISFVSAAVPLEVEAGLRNTPLGQSEASQIAEWAAVAGRTEERRFQFRIADGIAAATLVSVTAQRTAEGRVLVEARWIACSTIVQPQLRLVEQQIRQKKVWGVTVSSSKRDVATYRARHPTTEEYDKILAKLMSHAEVLLPQN